MRLSKRECEKLLYKFSLDYVSDEKNVVKFSSDLNAEKFTAKTFEYNLFAKCVKALFQFNSKFEFYGFSSYYHWKFNQMQTYALRRTKIIDQQKTSQFFSKLRKTVDL